MYRCRDSLVREGGGLENHWWQHLGSSNLPFGVKIFLFWFSLFQLSSCCLLYDLQVCRKFSAEKSYFLQWSALINSFDLIFLWFRLFFHFIFCNQEVIRIHTWRDWTGRSRVQKLVRECECCRKWRYIIDYICTCTNLKKIYRFFIFCTCRKPAE